MRHTWPQPGQREEAASTTIHDDAVADTMHMSNDDNVVVNDDDEDINKDMKKFRRKEIGLWLFVAPCVLTLWLGESKYHAVFTTCVIICIHVKTRVLKRRAWMFKREISMAKQRTARFKEEVAMFKEKLAAMDEKKAALVKKEAARVQKGAALIKKRDALLQELIDLQKRSDSQANNADIALPMDDEENDILDPRQKARKALERVAFVPHPDLRRQQSHKYRASLKSKLEARRAATRANKRKATNHKETSAGSQEEDETVGQTNKPPVLANDSAGSDGNVDPPPQGLGLINEETENGSIDGPAEDVPAEPCVAAATAASPDLQFKIPNFVGFSMGKGQSVLTPSVQAYGKRWKLNLYPRGDTDSSKGFVACFLRCVTKDCSVEAKANILCGNHVTKLKHLTYALQYEWGAVDWVHRDILLDPANGCVDVDGALIVYVVFRKKPRVVPN